MPFAFAMLICRARNALPMSTWHLTALCMSGFKHTQFHKSFTFQVYSCLAERLPVVCLDTLGCVITCGVRVCLHGKTPSRFTWGYVCMLGVILCALGETCYLRYLWSKFRNHFRIVQVQRPKYIGKDWWWGLHVLLGIKCVNCALIRWQRGKHQVKNI